MSAYSQSQFKSRPDTHWVASELPQWSLGLHIFSFPLPARWAGPALPEEPPSAVPSVWQQSVTHVYKPLKHHWSTLQRVGLKSRRNTGNSNLCEAHLLFALLHPSFLHQADKLTAVLITNWHITATGDQFHHWAIRQQSGVDQLLPKSELKCLLVHVLHGLQKVYLNTCSQWGNQENNPSNLLIPSRF